MTKKKEVDKTFTVKYTDSAEKEHTLECEILNPTTEQLEESDAVYNRAWKKALKNGAILAAKLRDFVREHELWNDEKDAEVKELRQKLHNNEVKLAAGGISLQQARDIAIDMRKLRFELRQLLTIETELENRTAESQAEDARHNYLIATCTVYTDSREPVWKDVAEYLTPDIPELAGAAALKYAKVRWGVDDNFEAKLPENSFLKDYGFVNEDLRLIRKSDGKFVDADGNLINEEGYRIDEEGNRIDDDGNPITDDGLVKVENPQPFLDEEGNPVEPMSASSPAPTEET